MPRFDQISDPSRKSFLHRGGRIVKWKGGAASMVPQVAELRLTVSAAAVGAALIFGTGMVGTAPAMAGTCDETPPGSGEFVCADPTGADVTQILGGAPVTVTTEAGFGITTVAGNALQIDGLDGASFDDSQTSDITGQQNGISINNANAGSLSVVSNGTVTGLAENGIGAQNAAGTLNLSITSNAVAGANDGIYAIHEGTGGVTVTSTGTATGTFYDGIDVLNAGTYLTVNAVDTNGGENGILATNEGTLALTITSTGTATGNAANGIEARNFALATDLTINSNVATGGLVGIQALNEGRGGLTITATGTTTGTNASGIFALNSANSTSLSITAADVTGGTTGISALNLGTAGLTISVTGDVTGETAEGINAYNSANDITASMVINQDAGTTIIGATDGISADNLGGSLTINALGTVIGETGDGIDARNLATATDLTITSNIATGATNGIFALNQGDGALTITSTGTATGNSFNGILASNSAAGTDLTINAVDTFGDFYGIVALNLGTEALTITSTGTATGTNYDGIRAYNSATGTDLTVNAADTNGYYNGINAFNYGTGALTITSTGTATGTNDNGIDVQNTLIGTDVTVNAVNTFGDDNGIDADNYGTGALTITSTGTATGTTDNGIDAYNSAIGTDLTVNAADTNGDNYGIYAQNRGNGALTINSTGTATGTIDDGIDVQNSATGTDVTVNAVNTFGDDNGIDAENYGTGALTITSTGTATGTTDDGIEAYNSGTDLTVNAVDTNGNDYGIHTFNRGTEALTITSTGTATGTTDDGIYAYNSGDGTSLSITAANAIGGVNGIRALNYGTAGLTINVTGNVTGQSEAGVFAYNSANDISASMVINQDAGTTITGATDGMYANNFGGSLTINVLGTVIGEGDNGIEARNRTGTADLTITSNIATGNNDGIRAIQQGTGALNITSTGTATGTNSDGIDAVNQGAASDLIIASNIATGFNHGIDARNYGTGVLTVTSTGTATGTSFDGINAYSFATGTGLTINAADTNGYYNGIDADNNGAGALTITSTGTATGDMYSGIDAFNSNNGMSLSITAANATGGVNGINALNYGSGGLTINTTGNVTGQDDDGVFAYNGTNDAFAVINQDAGTTITGADDGVLAENLGGSLTITALGTVIGQAGDGIDARNRATTTDLTITSNIATGDNNGIFAFHEGSGALTITSTGTATGDSTDGIEAYNFDGTDLTINAFDTVGDDNGIDALNEGTGALTITSTGTATGSNFYGISAVNSVNGSSLSITAANAVGGISGIRARNYGTAGLTISTTGDVTGESAAGIDAYNSANDITASMVIDQDADTTITGATDGMYAENFGGSLTINALGTVIGETDDGIDARNRAGTTDLTITSNIATGATNGIDAFNQGTGALTVNSTGVATGTDFFGIFAQNTLEGTDLTVTSVDAVGDNEAIMAINNGTGALIITSTGAASSTNSDAIEARNSGNGADLTVTAFDTDGGESGILANNDGTGALSITSTGTASGATFDGISAFNSAAGTSLSVTAADATGGINGIDVLQEGIGVASVTTTGTVAGGTGNAITAETTGSAIIVNNSGTLESGAGFALEAIGGVTQLTNSGTINGRVLLSAFDDVTVNNGLFNATLNSDFGAGNDLFTNEGTVLVGGNIAFNNLEQFVNDGLIEMRNGVIGNSLTLPGDYVGSGDGSFAFDVTFDGAGSADTLVIAGAATGSNVFEIDDISTSPNFGNMVLVVDAGAGTNEDAFALADESQTIGFFAYSVFYDAPDNDFFLTNTIGTPVFQTLKFVEGAQSLWYRSADAWAAHMATPTDDSASPAWMQIYGTVTNQDDSFEFSAGGLTEPISVNYEQDYFGFQAGYEFGTGVIEDGVLFGLTGGYLNSNLGFDGTADNVRYDAFNVGAYAGLKSDRFFANVLAKYDFITADVSAPTAGYTADLDGYAYGVRLEAGYRFGDEKFFVQPLTSFEYQRASLDDFSALGANIDFDRFDGLRGMIGARLGGETKIKWGNNLTYYLGGQAVHQSQTGDGLTFTSGDTSIEIENRLSKTFGRFELGLSIATQGGVTGFIEGNADISGDYTGYGGRGGLKVQF
ncbi:hypothetical protein [Sphingorhabdus sp. EL138]|uniref:hypothetical protein n=1 Tax=Sphingorhabdus sp. EL138 TaxID=2073156 RepID=UPI000D68EA61|nr:hypothetical protein [Sphingorhabdus sp. EL138]